MATVLTIDSQFVGSVQSPSQWSSLQTSWTRFFHRCTREWGHDPLYKLRPFIHPLLSNFVFSPRRYLWMKQWLASNADRVSFSTGQKMGIEGLRVGRCTHSIHVQQVSAHRYALCILHVHLHCIVYEEMSVYTCTCMAWVYEYTCTHAYIINMRYDVCAYRSWNV